MGWPASFGSRVIAALPAEDNRTMADEIPATSATTDRGNILLGFAIAWAGQFLSYWALCLVGRISEDLRWMSLFWAVPEFFFLIPVIIKLNNRGTDKTAKGLLIMSLIGLVLSCGFAYLLFTVMDHLPG